MRPTVAALLAFLAVGGACYALAAETRTLAWLAEAAGCAAPRFLLSGPTAALEARTSFAAGVGAVAAAIVLGGILSRSHRLGFATALVLAAAGVAVGLRRTLDGLALACAPPQGIEVGTLSISLAPTVQGLVRDVLPLSLAFVAIGTLVLRFATSQRDG